MLKSPADVMLQPLNFHVLLFRERVGPEEVWVAQCLDYDITAQGATIREAQADFERTVLGEIVVALEKGEVPLAGIVPAPSQYRLLWERAVRLAETLPLAPAPDMSPAIRERPERVPRGEAEFRVAA